MSTTTLSPGTSYPAVIGGVLVKLRDKINLRQSELAATVGVTQATWSRIENGSSALTVEQLGLAATKLGVLPNKVLLLADQASIQLKAQGVQVKPSRISGGVDAGIALIGAAALGALIAAVILGKK